MTDATRVPSFAVLKQREPITRQRRLHAGADRPAGQPVQTGPSAADDDQALRQGHAAVLERIEHEVRDAAMRRAESEGAEKVARLEAAAISRLENERQLLIGELQDIRKRLSSSLEALEAQRRELLEQSERFAVTVAYTAVSRIVGVLAEEGKLVGALVSRAVEESRLGGPFVVRVAKEDHEHLLSLALPEGLSVELLPDEKLKPGSCVVEFENGSMDAGLDAQLVAIKDALLRSLSGGRAEAS